MINGIDVSRAQGQINWDKVASHPDIKFAICKSTEGATYVDPMFNKHWEGIKKVGLIRGCYHFANTRNSPLTDAANFLNVVKNIQPGDLLCLDIEVSALKGNDFNSWVLTWLEQVESATGVKPVIYTGGPFFTDHAGVLNEETLEKYKKYDLWLAAYVVNPKNYIPKPWKEKGYTIWQKSGDIAAPGDSPKRIDGIGAVVDWNVYDGTSEQMLEWALSLTNAQPTTGIVDKIKDFVSKFLGK